MTDDLVLRDVSSGIRHGHARRSSRAPGRRALDIIRAVLLNVAAVGGAICIVLVVLAVVFNITLILFRTGSMAPDIPAGSVAVVKQIPADQARVGQVVTVDRPHELPITHRVVAMAPGRNGSTVFTLKGDANPAPDITTYDVTTVRLVIWSAPGLARVVIWLSNPYVLGGIAVAVAAIVTWALWPHGDDDLEGEES